jgi:hypothetical protein
MSSSLDVVSVVVIGAVAIVAIVFRGTVICTLKGWFTVKTGPDERHQP